jgi:NADH dehydrogenase
MDRRQAVEYLRTEAGSGVRRIVHVSITHPTSSTLGYFRGKALAEEAVTGSSLSHAIIRPTVLFGGGDILINNIAWLLRRLPVFAVAGSGGYVIRPVHVDDVAALAVDAGRRDDDLVVDAVGPETYAFEALVRLIAEAVGRRPRIVHVGPGVAVALAKVLGVLVRDVLLTEAELRGLMDGLVATDGPSTGTWRVSVWLEENASELGSRYASDLGRHYR